MSYVFCFVLTELLLIFDFWVVKNISGRILVGLRWWNIVKEDKTNEWVYESSKVIIYMKVGLSKIR